MDLDGLENHVVLVVRMGRDLPSNRIDLVDRLRLEDLVDLVDHQLHLHNSIEYDLLRYRHMSVVELVWQYSIDHSLTVLE